MISTLPRTRRPRRSRPPSSGGRPAADLTEARRTARVSASGELVTLDEQALAAVDRLADTLAGYHAYHATRADLPRRPGGTQKSRAAYDKAIELAGNTTEIAYLTHRRDRLG